jgi:hypothetical protein
MEALVMTAGRTRSRSVHGGDAGLGIGENFAFMRKKALSLIVGERAVSFETV